MADTPKGLTYPPSTGVTPDVPRDMQGLANDVDLQLEARDVLLGVSSASNDGSGTKVRSGKSIIAAEETRNTNTYGTLTTPDQVQNVVLPTDGLLMIGYYANWKCSNLNLAKAAIFLNSNQIKVGTGTPIEQEVIHQSTTANRYMSLCTFPQGLTTLDAQAGASSASVVTTGQIIATTIYGAGPLEGGGVVYAWATAGTYTISIQYLAAAGSVTVKERRLWVRALAF